MFLSSPYRQAPLWPRLAVIAGAASLALWSTGQPVRLRTMPSTDPIVVTSTRGAEASGGVSDHEGAGMRRAPFPGPYAATLVRVVDGDTFETRVRIWFGDEISTLVRIRGIDAPELHARCDGERQGAEAAREALGLLLAGHEIELSDVAPDKYFGRVVANVWVADENGARDVAATMQQAGLARAYDGHRRASWCDTASAR